MVSKEDQQENSLQVAYEKAADVLRKAEPGEVCRRTGAVFADGIYEVSAVLDGHLVDNGPHMARLKRSLAEIELACPVEIDDLPAEMERLIEAASFEGELVVATDGIEAIAYEDEHHDEDEHGHEEGEEDQRQRGERDVDRVISESEDGLAGHGELRDRVGFAHGAPE